MKRIGIICKSGTPEPINLLRELLPWLEERSIEVFLETEAANHLNIMGYPRHKLPGLIDLLVVLGGDGTMLSAARLVADSDIPIFGINLGGLGFITEAGRNETFDVIGRVISKDCFIEERMLLTTTIYRDSEVVAGYTVLNDVVINKGALARIFDVEVYIDDRYVTTIKADGVIFSTPTGSTAYSLSAGGPILYPTLHCIAITPICPHTLTNRPLVIEDTMVVQAVVKSGSKDTYLTLDGQVGFPLMVKDTVEIKKSSHKTKLLVPNARDYFQVLRSKLRWGER
ncbi:MAG: NAD(+)/NADH kinase [Nitrospirae bacterium]|nr:NAD(+)/NADH kinase [Nitrospirota bacterium]